MRKHFLTGNVVVGILNGEVSNCWLLNCVEMEKCDAQAIVILFNTSLEILYPNGIKRDKVNKNNFEQNIKHSNFFSCLRAQVVLFVTDGAPYMRKAGKALQLSYSRLIHMICLDHALRNLYETIREQYPQVDLLISEGKKAFLKSP